MAKIEGSRERIGNPAAENAGGAPAGFGFKIARARYDFAADGGAVGNINLLAAADIPVDAVILGGYVDVITAVTGGASATLALSVEAANDIVAAAAVTGAPWSTTGRKSIVPNFAGANTVRASVARNVVAAVAVAALTAGKLDVVLFYVEAPQ